jgi:hypothetical protein
MLSKRITYRKRKVHEGSMRVVFAEFWVETWWLLGVVPVFSRERLITANLN